ncbi:MAG: carbamoyltransferase HypF, partial [Actinomycetota bacterium]|nr:carbamoyltransferase HypF [Actinomycetota bacterium]
PLACPACGPTAWLETGEGRIDGTDAAIAGAQQALADGRVVAVKGLGGYHIACAAGSDAAVALLRQRKGRAAKPFAVMARDVAVAAQLAMIDEAEARLLQAVQRPIVLLARTAGTALSPLVAPDNPQIGVMLPYTPLHHLLFNPVPGHDAAVPEMLVMTSGNLTDEPICYTDADARQRLARLADIWLVHNRPIHVPCDDSVVRVVDGQELPIRRSRGYAPLPVTLPMAALPVLAVGGELKNTFCLAAGRNAWMSQHIGDMGSVETLAAFEHSTEQFRDMYQIEPEVVAADAHPGYQTRRWAEAAGPAPVELVQHHHAHVASVMAEHGVEPGNRVIGFAFDGTGYGSDGAIWGGEVLVAGYRDFVRCAHLRYVPLPGGDATIRRPYRAALAHLWAAGIAWSEDLAPVQAAGPDELAVLRRQLERNFGCVPTSSMGRLFDAVSSLLGVRHQVSYEAQAAIEMETQAVAALADARRYRFDRQGEDIDAAPVLHAIVDDLASGWHPGPIAAGFHQAVAELVVALAVEIRHETGIPQVALTGGVFQNVLLLRLCRDGLAGRGFDVLTHRLVPPNDGGLALGQVMVVAARAAGAG